jgi:dolichyl-phosphate beta-glucosyltransferase
MPERRKAVISLVIPMYNEQEVVEVLKEKLHYFFEEYEEPYEVLFVNDGSTDKTLEKLNLIGEENYKTISYEENRGKGYALRQGVKHAQGDYIFFTDADLAYGLGVIPRALEIFRQTGCDIVIGSRAKDEVGYQSYTPLRKIMSHTFRFIVRNYLHIFYSDTQCGLKGFRKETAQKLFSQCQIDRFGIDFELLYLAARQGFHVQEMGVRVINHGKSSVDPVKDSIRMLKEMAAVKRLHP